jgi:Ser/Thr protein kinase RdoA (MazF antagonist)
MATPTQTIPPKSNQGFFFELTPDRVLEAVESSGLLCTGRCMALNSFENRVYDVELETEEESEFKHLAANRRVVKFYRPGRWSEEQILEEHQFLLELNEAEIPVVAPLAFPDGRTLHSTRESEIWFSIFPKVGGRAPDELSDDQLVRVGRLLGRIHNVGAARKSQHRVNLTPATYGTTPLQFLIQGNWIPIEYLGRYQEAVEKICKIIEPWFKSVQLQRLHGDCHLGNLLWNTSGPFFLDFDDMVVGPPVQDIWLLVPGRDAESVRQRQVLLDGYQEIRQFDYASLKLIEPLRALRFIHYTAWIARRWDDPAFPLAFPQFGSHQYWSSEVEDLEEQLNLISSTSNML